MVVDIQPEEEGKAATPVKEILPFILPIPTLAEATTTLKFLQDMQNMTLGHIPATAGNFFIPFITFILEGQKSDLLCYLFSSCKKMHGQDYDQLKRSCQANGEFFKDPEFRASRHVLVDDNNSQFVHSYFAKYETDSIEWLRPGVRPFN